MHIGGCGLAAFERWTGNRIWHHPPSSGARPGASCRSRDTGGTCTAITKCHRHQGDHAATKAAGKKCLNACETTH